MPASCEFSYKATCIEWHACPICRHCREHCPGHTGLREHIKHFQPVFENSQFQFKLPPPPLPPPDVFQAPPTNEMHLLAMSHLEHLAFKLRGLR